MVDKCSPSCITAAWWGAALRRTMTNYNNYNQDCLKTNHQWPTRKTRREPISAKYIEWVECKLCGKPRPTLTKRTPQPRSELEQRHTARLKSNKASLVIRLWEAKNKERRDRAEQFIQENTRGLQP